MDLALNNLQRLICHKTKQTKPKIDGIALRPDLLRGDNMETQEPCTITRREDHEINKSDPAVLYFTTRLY